MNIRWWSDLVERIALFILLGVAAVYVGLGITVWLFSVTGCSVEVAEICAAPVCIVAGYWAYKRFMFPNMSITRLLARIKASRIRRQRRLDAARAYERYQQIKAARGSSKCVPYFEEHFGEPVQKEMQT